jgi:hypothetical protein
MTRNDARRRVKAIDREIKILCHDLAAMNLRREKLNAKDGDFTEAEETAHLKLSDDIEALHEEITELEVEKEDIINEHFEPDPKERKWELMP